MTADISVTASFAIDTFTLTYTAGANGTITGDARRRVDLRRRRHRRDGGGRHRLPLRRAGATASLTSPRTDTNVTADISVTASFAIDTFTLTYTAGANGTITRHHARRRVPYGGDGTAVTAVPDTGYHFVKWSDGGRPTRAPTPT